MIPLVAIDSRIPDDFVTDVALHRTAWRSLYPLDPENKVVAEANVIGAGMLEVSADGLT
jgi:hypothetical protein